MLICNRSCCLTLSCRPTVLLTEKRPMGGTRGRGRGRAGAGRGDGPGGRGGARGPGQGPVGRGEGGFGGNRGMSALRHE